jgi:ABC-type multidrug transport system fused ATPase/permease subunit
LLQDVQQTPLYRETFARLIGFLKPYRWSLAISIVLAVGSQAASIGLVLVTGSVIDRAIIPERRD